MSAQPKEVLLKGITLKNPILVMLLGGCPTLAVTTSAINGFGMGVATMFVMIASNAVISLIRDFIPDNVRIPCYITVIAAFVTLVDLVMAAETPVLHAQLGIFIPLIVSNCIPLERIESFAAKNLLVVSMIDGAGMGLGFTLALTIVGSLREIIGSGMFLGHRLFPGDGILFFVLAPGAFLCLGFVIFLFNKLVLKKF